MGSWATPPSFTTEENEAMHRCRMGKGTGYDQSVVKDAYERYDKQCRAADPILSAKEALWKFEIQKENEERLAAVPTSHPKKDDSTKETAILIFFLVAMFLTFLYGIFSI